MGSSALCFSSKFWEPTASASEEDIAVDVIGEEQITDQVSSFEEEPAEVESVPLVVQPIQPVWLGPRPKGIPKARAGVPEFGRRDAASETINSSSERVTQSLEGSTVSRRVAHSSEGSTVSGRIAAATSSTSGFSRKFNSNFG